MIVWRLIPLQTHDAYMNMAIDEAVLQAIAEAEAPNTIRFYRWKPSAVSIGRFQNPADEANIDNCIKQEISIVRRISGGGAVYHDSQGEITYSVAARKEDMGTLDVATLYTQICKGLIHTITNLGVKADFNPGDYKQCPNITINGKKVSGSAQYHRGNLILQHGTLLLNADLTRMFTFLKVKWAKNPAEIACIAENKITSLRHELGREVDIQEALAALETGFQEALQTRFQKADLTSYEVELAEMLRRRRYATRAWNFEGKPASASRA